MKQIRDYKKQCTDDRYIFFFLSFTSWGAWSWWEINCSAKLTSFRRGVYVIDSKILELRILSKDLFPNLALLQCHESDNQRALYSCVSCRVVNVVCLCAKQKHMHPTVSRRKRYKTGRPYKPCIKHICSKYCCFQSHIVLLKAFSLYICF